MTHPDFLELAAASIDFELSRAEREQLDRHLETCVACRRAVAGMRADARGIAVLPRPVIPERHAGLVLAAALGHRRRAVQPVRVGIVVALIALLAFSALVAGGALSRWLEQRSITVAPTTEPTPFVTSSPSASSPLITPVPAAWQLLSPMPEARSDMQALWLVRGGYVLVAGGHAQGSGGPALSSSDLFNPSTASWVAHPSMATARARSAGDVWPLCTSTQHTGGNPCGFAVLSGGVDSAGHALSSVEVFDFVTLKFSSARAMHDGRADHMAIFLESGRLLIAGGYGSSGQPLASAELFDPASDTWTFTGSMHDARANATMSLLPDGTVLVAGGFGSGGTSLSSAEVYDPSKGTWARTGSMAHDRSLQTATVVTDGVLVAGGYDSTGAPLASAELYDAASGTFSAVASMRVPRYRQAAVSLSGHSIVVIGGKTTGDAPTATVEVLDLTTGSWTAGPDLRVARSSLAAVYMQGTFLFGGALPANPVLVFGGDAGNGASLADVEVIRGIAPGGNVPLG